MQYQTIVDRVAEIVKVINDSEAAHEKEDALREDFLKYLSHISIDDCQDAKELYSLLVEISNSARLVLSTSALGFSRWYA